MTAEIEGEAETDLEENVASDTEANMETDVTRTDTGMSNAFSGMVVGDLVGLTVVEADGDTIGDIDYVIKTDAGYAAVVGVGGFLGLGEHTVAVPLEEISMAAENDKKLMKIQSKVSKTTSVLTTHPKRPAISNSEAPHRAPLCVWGRG